MCLITACTYTFEDEGEVMAQLSSLETVQVQYPILICVDAPLMGISHWT